jgi:hypothetical protein
MIISGSGILSDITVRIQPNFKPLTKLALAWKRLSDGNYSAVDRTSAGDVYDAEVTIVGSENTVQELIEAVVLNRNTASGNAFTLDDLNAGEQIFGCDVDYTDPLSCTIMSITDKAQNNFKTFSTVARLRLFDPVFTGEAALPTLKPEFRYSGDSPLGVSKQDTYYGNMFYGDRINDAGLFEAVYRLTEADMRSLRRLIATQRKNTISIPSLAGVTNPFGKRKGAFPLLVKIIEWEDLGQNSYGNNDDIRKWSMRLTMAEVI